MYYVYMEGCITFLQLQGLNIGNTWIIRLPLFESVCVGLCMRVRKTAFWLTLIRNTHVPLFLAYTAPLNVFFSFFFF